MSGDQTCTKFIYLFIYYLTVMEKSAAKLLMI